MATKKESWKKKQPDGSFVYDTRDLVKVRAVNHPFHKKGKIIDVHASGAEHGIAAGWFEEVKE